jgi:tRNA/rRNA methyltransferase
VPPAFPRFSTSVWIIIQSNEADEKINDDHVRPRLNLSEEEAKMVPREPDPRDRFVVILARPQSLENIGLAARAMKNTGFRNLRVVGRGKFEISCPQTAVHAKDILREASFHTELASAIADLNVVFASTAKPRQNFSVLPLDEAISRMLAFPDGTKIGLLFGNERTGLTSAELAASNFRWTIPQASRQPSYNLAAAVLITLFEVFRRIKTGTVLFSHDPVLRGAGTSEEKIGPSPFFQEVPLPRKDQEECIRLILQKLEEQQFIHPTNRRHTTQMLHDLLGRLSMTDRDRKLLLAMFSHARPNK